MESLKTIPQDKLKHVEIHLVDHCNLNCKFCDHFAPLAKKFFLSVDEFQKDIERLAYILKSELEELMLLGGEPLLHPNLIKFFPIARKYFPKTKIILMTNAILLKVQTKEFWDALKENSIDLTVTKYPIDLNWEELEAIANTNGIDIIYYKDKNELKTSYHVPLDLDGKQNCLKSFLGCFHANNCVLLKQGRLYTCSIIANIIHFNEFFHKNLVFR